jgi:hypothetical protein
VNSLTEFQQGKENTIMKRFAWLVLLAGSFAPLASAQGGDQEDGLRLDIGDEIYFNHGTHNNLRVAFGPGYPLLTPHSSSGSCAAEKLTNVSFRTPFGF